MPSLSSSREVAWDGQLESQVAVLAPANAELEQHVSELRHKLQDFKGDLAARAPTSQEPSGKQYSGAFADMLRDKERELAIKDDTIAELSNQLRATAAKKNDLAMLAQEKDRSFQILHDEFSALQLELDAVNRKLSEVENENRELVERWLRKMNTDVTTMNEVNDFYETLVNAREAADRLQPACAVPRSEPTKAIIPKRAVRYDRVCDDSPVHHVAWSSDAKRFAVACGDRFVRLYDDEGNLKRPLSGCMSAAMYVQFRRDGRLLLGTSNDNAVRIWSSENDQPKLTLTGHIGNVWTASFMAERQHIASASHDRTVKIWDAERGTCIRTIFAHSSVNDLCLADDSGYDRIITGHADSAVRVWDTNSGSVIKEIKGIHAGQVTSVSVAPDAYQILTCSRDNTLKLLDIRTFRVLCTYSADGFRVGTDYTKSCFSPDGRFVTGGSHDGRIFIWDTAKGFLETELQKHRSAITALAWSPNGSGTLLTAELRSHIALWEM